MSATGRGGVRHEQDFYATPPWCVERICSRLRDGLLGRVILDPCCGDGAILNEVERLLSCTTVGVELDAGRARLAQTLTRYVLVADALVSAWPAHDVVITNPPYSLLHPFLASCHERSARTIMLLRLNILGGIKRQALLDKLGAVDVYVLPRRPSFTRTGTDATEYAWFDWGRHAQNRIERLPV